METLPYLNEEEKARAYNCAVNIEDRLNAIKSEILNERPYKSYLLEKLESVKWDTDCLLSMCQKGDNTNE